MLHTIITSLIFILIINNANSFDGKLTIDKSKTLKKSIKSLFSHKNHLPSFKTMKILCEDCHSFSLKPKKKGPLAQPIDKKHLKPSMGVCHQCHRGQITTPRRNQCTLCHLRPNLIMPKNHHIYWKNRHGKRAQFDQASCTTCHKRGECSKCHIKRDVKQHNVHRGNFKYTHSIEARLKPSSCVKCHKSRSFCTNCHKGKRR